MSILILHSSIACLSLVQAVITVLFPSVIKLRITYILSFATLFTGSLLLIFASASVASVCIKGAVFLGVIAVCSFIARRKISLSHLY